MPRIRFPGYGPGVILCKQCTPKKEDKPMITAAKPTLADVKVGNVLRMVFKDGNCSAFSDCVIILIEGETVHLCRPYVLTVGGLPQAEEFSLDIANIVESEYWRVVVR